MKYILPLLVTMVLYGQHSVNGATRNSSLTNCQNIETINGLEFPSNGDDPSDAFVAFQFLNPQDNGLPIWGPSHRGVTWIWRYKPKQQAGYYVTFWWAENSGNFTWDGGNSNSYYGCHPYPQGGGGETTEHYWELAGMESGADHVTTESGSPLEVVKGQWYTQAFRVRVNSDGSKTGRFYIDLPDTSDSKIIEFRAAASWGEKDPPNPAVTFGDSPWGLEYYGTERLSGILGQVKIFNKALSLNDMKKEATDMSELQTTDGENNIWWGKNSFDTVDDLTCDYSTGRSFRWADSNNKANIVTLQRNLNFEPVKIGDSQTKPIQICVTQNPLTIYSASIVDGENFQASINGLPITLNPGDSIQADITFAPQTKGLLFDTLLISTTLSDSPLKYVLSGFGGTDSRVSDDLKTPESPVLWQNYPNPFNPITTFYYEISAYSYVTLKIYDCRGTLVEILVHELKQPGRHSIRFNASHLSSGIYFYKLQAGNNITAVRKMVLIS